MAITKTETQVEWSTADSKSVAHGATETSDEIAMPEAAFGAVIMAKADNEGTPASGDVIDWYVEYSTGDPDVDPDDTDEFDTVLHAKYCGQCDTNTEDPAIISFEVSPFVNALKLVAVSGAASNAITVSAQMVSKSS